jgi:hypothetical protein
MEESLLSAIEHNMALMMLEMHTAESLVPELSSFEVEIPIEKLSKYKSPGNDQIPEEMI